VSRVLYLAQRITDHFGVESFQAINCTGTDNTKQTGETTPETQKNKQTRVTGHSQVEHKNTQKTQNETTNLNHQALVNL